MRDMAPRSPENISRAVGHPPVDIPLGGRRVPEIAPAPRRKGHLRRDLAVAGGAAVIVATVAFGASQFNNGGARPSPEASLPGGIVEPSNSPNPTPFSTENPTITLPPSPTPETTPSPTPQVTIPTESFAPSTPAPIESGSVLEQRLTDWTNGKIKVPDSKKFTIHGKPAILNIIDNKPQPGEWYPIFQGYFLGIETVDNHLIAYLGSQDGKGQYYFVGFNVGELNNGRVGVIFNDPNRKVFPTGQANAKIIPLEEMQKLMVSNFKNDTVTFITTVFASTEQLDPRANIEELLAQLKVAKQYSLWSIEAATGNYKDATLAEKYPMAADLINHKITSFKSKTIPYGSVFWTPRNDV